MPKSNLKHVATHVPQETKQLWKDQADEMGASMSEYVQMMVSAGRKKFDRQVEPDKSRAELRKELGRVLDELEKKNEQVLSLRRQLHESERQTVIDYVSDNPGTSYGNIRQHLNNTIGGRMAKLLSELEGAELRRDDEGRYYAGDNTEGSTVD